MANLSAIPATAGKKQKRGRKFDRKRKRSQSHARYNSEKRWLKNKAKRVLKNNGPVFYDFWVENYGS